MSVNQSKVTEAVRALVKLLKKKSSGANQLLDIEHPDIVLLFSLTIIPQDSSFSPKFIQLPHRVSSKDKEFCLITGKNKALAEELVQKNHISDIKEVIDLKEFSELYKTPEQKREICAKYSIFLADELVLPQLSGRLGNVFFELKKLPMKIRVNSNLKENVNKCYHKSSLYISSGSLVTMRIGSTELSAENLTENIMIAIQKACEHFPGGMSSIKFISLKSYNTPALPVYELVPGSFPVESNEKKPSKTIKATKASDDLKKDIVSGKNSEKLPASQNSPKAKSKTNKASKPEVSLDVSAEITTPKSSKKAAKNVKAIEPEVVKSPLTPAKSPSKKASAKAANTVESTGDKAISTPVKSPKKTTVKATNGSDTSVEKTSTPVKTPKNAKVATPKQQTTTVSKKASVENAVSIESATSTKAAKRKALPEPKSEASSASNTPKKNKSSPKAAKSTAASGTTPITDRKTRSAARKN